MVTILGLFLIVQTLRIRFVFDDEALEVKTVSLGGGDDLVQTGENFAVGGENRWTYDSFVNWEFFPSVDLPILVYFKETQTKPEGQIHFFPILFNGRELSEVMQQRCGADRKSVV